MARPDPKIFIVWSSKYKYIAEQIYTKLLEKRKNGFPVYPIMFNLRNDANVNRDMHTSLINSMDSADYALILLTPDEEVMRRENGSLMGGFYSTSRPNVYFEYGYLSKQLSENNIFVYNAHGHVTASDTAALITNNLRIPSNIDEIIRLPENIAIELEKFFNEEKRYYYVNLNQPSYEINYSDIFHDPSRNEDYAPFIINKSINWGKYWRAELNRFPNDSYQIGRKIIYILERLPFNVYLYASPHSTSVNEQPQKFIDSEIISKLKSEIDLFLKTISEPMEFRNYMLYKSNLRMLEVIERYQIKRNDSFTLAFEKNNTYMEDTITLYSIVDYITKFPLSQLLFNRYLALNLHKKVFSMFNLGTIDFSFKDRIKTYFDPINDIDIKTNKFFISIVEISMALTYIDKTIHIADTYDCYSSVELHKSLALYDKSRMECIFCILLQFGKDFNILDEKDLLTNIPTLFSKKTNIEHIKELITINLKSRLKKSFHYGLIDFFKNLLINQINGSFTLETIELISNDIVDYIMRFFETEINYETLVTTYINSPNLNYEKIQEHKNYINNIWNDSPFNVVIYKKTSIFMMVDNIINGEDNIKNDGEIKDELEMKIINIITDSLKKINISIETKDIKIYLTDKVRRKNNPICNATDDDSNPDANNQYYQVNFLNILNNDSSSFKCKLRSLLEFEVICIINSIFKNLIHKIRYMQNNNNIYSSTWDRTIDTSIALRYNNWISAKDWPSNMRTVLLYEYYHALSEKYIYKISDNLVDFNKIKSKGLVGLSSINNSFKNDINEINSIISNKIDYDLIMIKFDSIKSKLIQCEIPCDYTYNKDQIQIDIIIKNINFVIEFIEYFKELNKIKDILENAKKVMEFNYELPDLSSNILTSLQSNLIYNNIIDWDFNFGIQYNNIESNNNNN